MEAPPAYQEDKTYPPGAYPPPQQGGAYPPPQQGGAYPPPQGGAYPPPQQGGTYPPPQPGYPAQPMVVQQPAVVVQAGVMQFGEHPQNIVCPNCHQNVVTAISYSAGTMTYLIALVLCLVFWPVVCVPCCVDACKDVTHQCPSCNNVVGHFKRM